MRTRNWLCLFAAIALLCTAVLLLRSSPAAAAAQILSDGKVVMEIDLHRNGEYRIEYGSEWNLLKVFDGKISVSAASCASQDCVRHAPADSGSPIVCLPNHLVVRFTESEYDAVLN